MFDGNEIPAFKALADSVHAYGTKLGVQLFHRCDVNAINSLFMQKSLMRCVSACIDMMFFTDEVEEMLIGHHRWMCACAVRAHKKAGVDVIQIHSDRLTAACMPA